jgi:hypothetical protein
MTASFSEPRASGMPSMLVVVRPLPAVVSKVKRGLDGLVAQRTLRVVLGRPPLGVHVIHGAVSSTKLLLDLDRSGGEEPVVATDRVDRPDR